MTTFWKYLPWIISVVLLALLLVWVDKYNKAKAANGSLASAAVDAATAGNTGIAGGIGLDMAAETV